MKWKLITLAIILAFVFSAVGAYASQRIPPVIDPKYTNQYYIPLVTNNGFGGYYTSLNFMVKSGNTAYVRLFILEPNGNVPPYTRDYTLIGYGSMNIYFGDGTYPSNFIGSALLLSTQPLAVVVHTNGPSSFGTYLVPNN